MMMMKQAIDSAALAAAAVLFFFLVMPVSAAQMRPVDADSYPVFADDLDYSGLERASAQSIAYYEKLPGTRLFEFGPDTYTAGELAAGLKRFKKFVAQKPDSSALNEFLKQNARVYTFAEKGDPVRVLFTGYYEPLLFGSRTRTDKFRYPVYSRPKDLVRVDLSAFDVKCSQRFLIGRYAGDTVVPYYDRRTIETAGVLGSRAEPIAWVKDPVKLFFLHVQGSGQIEFENGHVCHVHFDITNGRPYRSIGKYLIEEGKISVQKMSMQAIRHYIRQNPLEMYEIFFYNPRYVFFKASEGGPLGSLGVELTPGRSLALDQKITPSGALLFASAKKPVIDDSGGVDHWEPFSRFMCSHDTGNAIRGAKRADIFWGSGDYAEIAAGYMKHRGRLYFLVIEQDLQ